MKELSRRTPGRKPPARPHPAASRAAASTSGAAAGTSVRLASASGAAAGTSVRPTAALGAAAKAQAALDSLVYIALPETASAHFGGLALEKDVPLPVQRPNVSQAQHEGQLQLHRGAQAPAAAFDLASLRSEHIVAGILRVLAWDPDNTHAAYYRRIAKTAKPGLLEELSSAGVEAAQERNWDVAEEIFLALVGLYPERPEPLVDLAFLHEQRAELLAQEGRDEDAEFEDEAAHELYTSLLSREPPFAQAFYYAALFFLKKRTVERAVSLLTTYVGMDDDEEKTARARDLLKKLNESGYLDTLFKEAYDFIRMGEEERGLGRAREFIKRYPAVWNGWFLAGWACRRLGRWEEGRDAFLQALSLGAEEADTYNELSICQSELGEDAGARKSLERALRAEPENIKIIANLGALAFKQGKKGEAAGFFRAALDIDPDDQFAADWLARIHNGAAE